jgi:hypothetical protein
MDNETTNSNLRTYLINQGRYRGLNAIACAKCWYAELESEGVPTCGGQHESVVAPEMNTSLIAVLKGTPTPMAKIGTKYREVDSKRVPKFWMTAI